jgi:hypothetical protein
MKVNCGPSKAARERRHKEREQALREWHPFFPLWPRRVGENDCRLLEWIERRKVTFTVTEWDYGPYEYEDWRWEYRA